MPHGRVGVWDEELALNGAEIEALRNAPVLLDHRAGDSHARVGVVRDVRRQNGEIVALLEFSERPAVQDLLKDLARGIGGAVSVG